MTTLELLGLLKRIASEISSSEDQADWYLFGSALRDAVEAADYDVAIVCERKTGIRLRAALEDICLQLPIHLIILSSSENDFLMFTENQGAFRFHPDSTPCPD